MDDIESLIRRRQELIRRGSSSPAEAAQRIAAEEDFRSKLGAGQLLWHYLEMAIHDCPEDESLLARLRTLPWKHHDSAVARIWDMITDPVNEAALRERYDGRQGFNAEAKAQVEEAWRQMEARKVASPVASELARLWDKLAPERVGEYLKSSYGLTPPRLPEFVALHIVRVLEGKVDRRPAGQFSSLVAQNWTIDSAGLRGGYEEFDPNENDGTFCRHPIAKFYYESGRVLFSERLGPELMSRSVGKLTFTGSNSIEITDVELLWRQSPNPEFRKDH